MGNWTSKYANVATIITCIGMIAGALVFGVTKVRAMELGISNAISAAETAAAKNEQQDMIIAAQTSVLAKLETLVTDIHRRGLIIPRGKAFVMDAPGDAYLELNISDPGASRLLEFEFLKVTNMSNPDRPSAVIKVGPTFSNLTPDYVMQLSTEAGGLLHAAVGSWPNIRVEPIFEE